ncbi:MAG: acyl-CoA dehydrogenase family protein [Alphaproteobacteria bacterium]|nr:acyl-CoA dehydrogenase family protein [Alphaproteobacteria bacterium]
MDLGKLGFPLDDEHLAVSAMAREFARDRLRPTARERDLTGEYPLDLIGELAGIGLLAMKVGEEDGGSGLDNVSYVLAMEGIAEGCASVAVVLASSNLATFILGHHATEEQRKRWLVPYAAGDLGPASFALSEPHCGSDAAALKTTARRDGDDYVLDGSKMWITSGAYAGIHLVFAKTDPDAGPRGITCFLVEKGTPGLEVGREEHKMGQRASGTVALHFEGCRIPARNRIGEEGQGYGVALSTLAAGRVGMSGLCLGVAEHAFEEGLRYAAERTAFGKRVADFQNSQFVLADTRTDLDAAWLLALRAARLLDAGDRASSASSMAKVFASEALGRTVDRMLQLHGGYGYSQEYAIERLYRDARITRIYEGSSEIQRIVIAREILASLQ